MKEFTLPAGAIVHICGIPVLLPNDTIAQTHEGNHRLILASQRGEGKVAPQPKHEQQDRSIGQMQSGEIPEGLKEIMKRNSRALEQPVKNGIDSNLPNESKN